MAGFLREHTALSKRLLSSKNEASSKCRRAACSKADFIVGGVDVRQEQEAKSRSLLRRDDTRSPRCHCGLLVSLADGLYSLAYANTASSGRTAMPPQIRIRPALAEEVPLLRALIEDSVRRLQAQDYTPEQIEGALTSVFGVDTQLIADGTYLVAEAEPDPVSLQESRVIVAVAAGASAKRYTAPTSGPTATTIFSIPAAMPQKFAPSSFIRTGRAAA